MSSTGVWFSATSSLKNAVNLINGFEDGKLKKILARVVSKIHMKDENPFSVEEEEKLQTAFELSSDALDSLLAGISFIFQQAAYHNAKLQNLQQQLTSIELDENKVALFVESWKENGATVIQQLRTQNLGPKQLESVDWQLNIKASDSFVSNIKEPAGILQLGITSNNQLDTEKLQMEFNKEELFGFFKQLEDVQLQLDNLSK